MIHAIDLAELARLHGPERAFLTLYLRSKDDLPEVEDRIRRLHDVLDDEDEREHLDANASLLRELLESPDLGGRSACLFVCWALDVAHGHPLEVPVETCLHVGASPYLRPLAELQDERERYAVIAADNEVARIFVVRPEGPVEQDRVRGDVKNDVKVGGQSQKRYERRRDNALTHYAKDVAAALDELLARVPVDRVVLAGSEEATTSIREALSPEATERLLTREAMDPGDEERLWELAHASVEDEERREERALWERIRDGYFAGERATVGPGDTLAAAAAGRVERLLVDKDADRAATRCRSCGNASAGTPDTCPVCGSSELFRVDLVDELVTLTERFGAGTEFAEGIPGLERNGGVAALLRY